MNEKQRSYEVLVQNLLSHSCDNLINGKSSQCSWA